MAHSKQALKRNRQNQELRLKNRAARAAMKTVTKTVVSAATEGKTQDAATLLKLAYQKIDKCGKRNVIHKNAAARRKSKLAKKVNALLKGASKA